MARQRDHKARRPAEHPRWVRWTLGGLIALALVTLVLVYSGVLGSRPSQSEKVQKSGFAIRAATSP